jgi:ABC-2 type transport system permease protein
MHKYLALMKISWQNGLVYRTNVILWRFRQFITTLMALTIWNVVFAGEDAAFGYTQPTMITYIFLVSVLQSLILATALHGLAGRIYNGHITHELLKPVNIYAYFFSQDVADKLRNFGFIIVEIALLYWLFQPQIIWPDVATATVVVVWTLAAVILHFFISMLFGTIGFWSPDEWGPKFLFFMFIEFTAGKLFPLDILPKTIQAIIHLTPFPYLSFYQAQLFLGRLDTTQIITHSLGLLFWCLVFGLVMSMVWNRGMRSYEATGR